ncbi:hypothetical protein E2562_037728 [Oryza meyeriana var. granulata]|uniref:Exostosin GT47 domain-containing protein n=1 Tax=Oryza meyeriana var. granulata TaxID=110450 RepID=A0A6G1C3U5_9ORYZ|nr:hypothetical protein E2562_037728 [Oryza meyeriana var. granulata]
MSPRLRDVVTATGSLHKCPRLALAATLPLPLSLGIRRVAVENWRRTAVGEERFSVQLDEEDQVWYEALFAPLSLPPTPPPSNSLPLPLSSAAASSRLSFRRAVSPSSSSQLRLPARPPPPRSRARRRGAGPFFGGAKWRRPPSFRLAPSRVASRARSGSSELLHARGGGLLAEAVELVRGLMPYWNRSGGADHVFVASHDFGACFHPMVSSAPKLRLLDWLRVR